MQTMKFTILLFATLMFTFMESAYSQVTIEGGCTDLSVTGGIPNYAVDLYNGPWMKIEQCAVWTNYPSWTMNHQMFLQRLNHTTGQFENVSNAQYPPNNTFSNLEHGTYRVKVKVPIPLTSNSCASGYVNVYSSNNQYLGRRGWYPDNYEGEQQNVFYSNTVIVGNTVPSDNQYHFTEGNPSLSEKAMDLDEDVGLDASASVNYDQWYLAICENSFDNCLRYKSNGWTNGTVGQFDLKGFWQQGGWQFLEWMSYEVQFVVENSKCRNGVEAPPPWNENRQTFYICAAGTGCRFGSEEKEITIGPNPANTYVRLDNFNPSIDRDYVMSFTDLSGRTMKSVPLVSDQVDVSDLPGGMYAVNVLHDGHRLFTAKLIVNNH